METLKPEYREALHMIDLDEGTLNDLAAKSGITGGNAAVRVHRAREALRKQVRAACGSCAEHGWTVSHKDQRRVASRAGADHLPGLFLIFPQDGDDLVTAEGCLPTVRPSSE